MNDTFPTIIELLTDTDKNAELMRNGDPDSIGYWVYESLVEPVKKERR